MEKTETDRHRQRRRDKDRQIDKQTAGRQAERRRNVQVLVKCDDKYFTVITNYLAKRVFFSDLVQIQYKA